MQFARSRRDNWLLANTAEGGMERRGVTVVGLSKKEKADIARRERHMHERAKHRKRVRAELKRKDEAKGCGCLILIVLIGAIAYCNYNSSPSTNRSRNARNSRPPPIVQPEWYEGGTLHDALVSEWKTADARDKLATAADFAAAMLESQDQSFTIDDLREPAEQLVVCIDEATRDDVSNNLEVAEIAAACWILMHPDSDD